MPCRINSLQITRPPIILPIVPPKKPPIGPNNAVPKALPKIVPPADLAALTGSLPVASPIANTPRPAPAADAQFCFAASHHNKSPAFDFAEKSAPTTPPAFLIFSSLPNISLAEFVLIVPSGRGTASVNF